MRTGRVCVAVLAFLVAPLVACKAEEDFGVLDEKDFEVAAGGGFTADELLANDALTDSLATDATRLQAFFKRTPYDRSSFLETYSSNGVRASDALVRAARYYRVNPIVLLARAQTEQGLVGSTTYPFPTDRIEYTFRCGCAGPNVCDAKLAGFDKQVDCLAAQIRTALDEIARDGRTSGGWAPGQTQRTIDGVAVTPANEATAALYQVQPVVRVEEAGGTWVLSNVYRIYADALGYFGPGVGP